MNINRHNYEEFFLLYVDNELDAAGRRSVENFIAENPDLVIELQMLQDTVLGEEPTIHFEGKEALLKNESCIDAANHEEMFLLYHDNELTLREKEQVEQFVYKNPQYQQEFELISAAQLIPDNNLRFPDKSLLYRSEEERKVVVMRWWKIAAAAVVLLFLGVSAWYYRSGETTLDPTLAGNAPGVTTPLTDSNPSTPEKAELALEKNTRAEADNGTNVTTPIPQTKEPYQPVRKNEQLVAYTTPVKETEKIVPGDSNIPPTQNVTLIEPNDRTTATVSVPEVKNTMRTQETVIDGPVGMPEEEQEKGLASYAVNDGSIQVMNTSISNKTKMRGFFRKVSRVMEKATNIGPGENDNRKGVRIANFEIPLK